MLYLPKEQDTECGSQTWGHLQCAAAECFAAELCRDCGGSRAACPGQEQEHLPDKAQRPSEHVVGLLPLGKPSLIPSLCRRLC